MINISADHYVLVQESTFSAYFLHKLIFPKFNSGKISEQQNGNLVTQINAF